MTEDQQHDPADLKAWQWDSMSSSAQSAWSITRKFGLDPEFAQRIQRAADEGDSESFWEAVADFLGAVAEAEK
jgi:hypothetical protein